jgi:hypothetical protein
MNEYRRKLLNEIGINNSELYADWFKISRSGKLSEEFIREFKDIINWGNLCVNQVLSDDFLIEFQDNINWTTYFMNVDSSFFIMKKFLLKSYPVHSGYFKTSHFNEYQINELQRILDLHNIFKKDKFKL